MSPAVSDSKCEAITYTVQNSGHIQRSSRLISLGGIRPLFPEELRERILAGARIVRFEFCLSFLFVTIRRQSPLFFTDSWQSRYLRGLGYSVLALLLGPWGVPWGLIWTPWAIWTNLTGGIDQTADVLAMIEREEDTANSPL